MGTDREHGIEFGDLAGKLRSVDYPASSDAIRRQYGDHELQLAGGSTTLGDVLSGMESGSFESEDEVVQTVKDLVGSDAVGREEYTDRGGGGAKTEEAGEESF